MIVSRKSPTEVFATPVVAKCPPAFNNSLEEKREPSRTKADSDLDSKIISHVLNHGDDLGFTSCFWRKCEPNTYDLQRYSQYVTVIRLYSKKMSKARIADVTGVGDKSVASWVSFKQRPKLAHYLHVLDNLGAPRSGWTWLSVSNSSRFAVPYGPFLQVPGGISRWKDIGNVLDQMKLLPGVDPQFPMEYKFGFLLGVMIGDAAKKRQRKWHRHLELVLSKKYETNARIGDFMVDCARSTGLRAYRMPDSLPKNKPYGFYVWETQSSALVDWLFNVCLGLGDDELTTYNPVKMSWALGGPLSFRRGLIQGIAESDGSVNIPSQEVEFWVGPSWDFVQGLLQTFGIRSFRNRDALTISKSQVTRAYGVPVFAPQLRTIRYMLLEKLAQARHVSRGTRLSPDLRERIRDLSGEGHSVPTISERLLDERGYILSYETVQRWARRSGAPMRNIHSLAPKDPRT